MKANVDTFKLENSRISMEVREVQSVTCHWHDCLEVVWVVRGQTTLYESNMQYHLAAGDVYVVNYNETHKILSEDEPALLAFLYIDYRYFSKDVPNLKEISFAHYSFSHTPNPDAALASCRRYMVSLFDLLNKKRDKDAEKAAEELTGPFLKLLVNTFQYIYYVKENGRYLDIVSRSNLTAEQMERLHRITYYIYMHCHGKLTLDELAQTEFYSRFHISHFIKRAFGLSYQDTLSLCRSTIAERILLSTDYNLDEIATLVGFSTRSQFCRHFRKWHDMSPSQYRRENAPDVPGNLNITFPVDYETARSSLFETGTKRQSAR
ncbi:MAG: AraC family transcriptional regulator [Clostridiales Family XIII bacterium]|jgi:AraC-like DNA-binding protein|nr:AraC family transcriptional regulator [Clostridiales Family XIII bacterium]